MKTRGWKFAPTLAWLVVSLLITACSAGRPRAVPTAVPTVAPTVAPSKTPMPPDPVAQAIAGLVALDGAKSWQLSSETTSVVSTRLQRESKELGSSESLQKTLDTAQRITSGDGAGTRLRREYSSPMTSLVPLAGDLRWVGGKAYMKTWYLADPGGQTPFPTDWVPLNGDASAVYWPNGTYLGPGDMLQRVRGDASMLLIGRPLAELEKTIRDNLESASREQVTLEDGSSGELITFALRTGALLALVAVPEMNDPGTQRVLQNPQQASVTLRVMLDNAGRLAGLETGIQLQVSGLDFTGISGNPAGTTVDVVAGQSLKAKVFSVDGPVSPISAPAAEDVEHLATPLAAGGSANLPFRTLGEFDAQLHQAVTGGQVDAFWQKLQAAGSMPLVFDDCAVLLYRSPASQVTWNGDWSGMVSTGNWHFQGTDLWIQAARLPRDARLEYQVVEGSGEPGLDPLNPLVETGGLGSKSVLVMPDYQAPDYLQEQEGSPRGTLSGDLITTSKSLGYDVRYWVYTPAGYDRLSRLPVLYVTDGQDYLSFGQMVLALDNLIGSGQVQPLIAVFIDPRDLKSGENLREKQFLDNPKYGEFIAGELVPLIDRNYHSEPSPDMRALLGASYGGYHAAYFALRHADTIHCIAMQSPAFSFNQAILEDYRKAEPLPIKVFMNVGVMNDFSYHTRLMRDILRQKAYSMLYIESNEGHSYGNWRGKLGKMLEYFFPA